MKHFFKNYFYFFLFSVLIIILAFVFVSLTPSLVNRTNIKSTTGRFGESLLRYREAKEIGSIDVLFLGSSHCYRGFDTRVFKKYGITSFNMGSSSQAPINSFYLLQDYTNIKPKVIVLEVYWAVLQGKGVESSIDLISNTKLSINNFKMALYSKSIMPINSWLYQYIHRIVYPLNKESQMISKNDLYISGGYVKSKKDSNKLISVEFTKSSIKEFTQLNYLDSINSYCNKRNIKLLLVSAPVYKEVYENITNFKEKMNSIENFSDSRNIKFINFNSNELYSEIPWSQKLDWYDNTHLTHRGVEKFNNHFINKYQYLLVRK